MRIGFVGLGKLGMPVAHTLAEHHDVVGYDCVAANMNRWPKPYKEVGDKHADFNDDLADTRLRFGTLAEACAQDVVFVAVQTPHEPRYEGITPLPAERVDFDYEHLKAAVAEICRYIDKPTNLVIISTVLPGTMERCIRPLLNEHVTLTYNPFFIAMGTVIADFKAPEFILVGGDDRYVREVYQFIDAPLINMTVESAELTKVAYNTFISMKLGFVNTLLEVAHAIPGVDVDQVTDALTKANRRLISPAYMRAGMGDGGGCHPRDNIAMSHLARKLGMSFDFFEAVMMSREGQARWLAGLMKEHDLPKCILGYTFKPETNITTGSHALLVAEFLENCRMIDHHIDGEMTIPDEPCVFLIGMRHEVYRDVKFPAGSVVIDPWRYIPDQADVEVVRVGEWRQANSEAAQWRSTVTAT